MAEKPEKDARINKARRGGIKLSIENGLLVCENELRIRLLEQQFSVATTKQKTMGGSSTGENLIYVFQVTALDTEKSYLIYKRYSTILELQEKMIQKFGRDTLLKGGLSELPDKKKFHKENFSVRALWLQKYFDQLVVLVHTGSSINLSVLNEKASSENAEGSEDNNSNSTSGNTNSSGTNSANANVPTSTSAPTTPNNNNNNNNNNHGSIGSSGSSEIRRVLSRTGSAKNLVGSPPTLGSRKSEKTMDFAIGQSLLQAFIDPKQNIEAGVTIEMWCNPTKEGKLTKQGHVVKSWKSRWFILQENKLFYFKEKPNPDNPEPPLGVILLGFCTIEVPQNNKQGIWQFQILQSDWNAGKDFLIQAASKHDLEDWVLALRQAKVFHTKECYTLLEAPMPQEPVAKKVSAAESTLRKFVTARDSGRKEGASALINRFESTARKSDLLFDREKALVFPPDNSDNIVYGRDEDEKVVIKGGNILKLIQKLVDVKTTDINYMTTFLLTYRTFIDPHTLLTTLIKIFDTAISESNKIDNTTPISPAILRVTKVLQQWIDLFFDDFADDQSLTNLLTEFIDQKMQPRLETTANVIRKAIEKQLNPQKIAIDYTNAPQPILPSFFSAQTFDLIDIAPEEIARQLCLLEFSFFHKIRPKELLKQQWTKKDAETQTPNIICITKRFNRMSFWVTSLIVKLKDLKTRAALLKRFIEIAYKCLELRNYNSAVEILSGLGSASIHRLYKTWDLMDPKTMKMFEEVRMAMAPHKSYKNYRERLKAENSPSVPYLGVFLSDLTFVDEGNPDFMASNEKLINFEKRVLTAKVIMRIQKFQKQPYQYLQVPEIQSYLTNLDYLDEKEAYSLSILHEPRQSLANKNE